MEKLYKNSLAYASKYAQVDRWVASRMANANCRIDIEVKRKFSMADGKFTDDAIDALLNTYGKERVLYLLYITIAANGSEGYTSEEVDWLHDMADVYGLYWKDPSETGNDYQFDYALPSDFAWAWNQLIRQLRERQEEEDSGVYYVLCQTNNVALDITTSKPFNNYREAYKYMRSVYEELMEVHGDGNITPYTFSVFFDARNCYYGSLAKIDLSKAKK